MLRIVWNIYVLLLKSTKCYTIGEDFNYLYFWWTTGLNQINQLGGSGEAFKTAACWSYDNITSPLTASWVRFTMFTHTKVIVEEKLIVIIILSIIIKNNENENNSNNDDNNNNYYNNNRVTPHTSPAHGRCRIPVVCGGWRSVGGGGEGGGVWRGRWGAWWRLL